MLLNQFKEITNLIKHVTIVRSQKKACLAESLAQCIAVLSYPIDLSLKQKFCMHISYTHTHMYLYIAHKLCPHIVSLAIATVLIAVAVVPK